MQSPVPAFSLSGLFEFNRSPLQRLGRSLRLSSGQFSLIFIHVPTGSTKQLISEYLAHEAIACLEIHLHPSVTNLVKVMERSVGVQQPAAAIVSGLEQIKDSDTFWQQTNLMRDELRKTFDFPIVFCLNESLTAKLRRIAPDLSNWAAPPIRFISTPESRPLNTQDSPQPKFVPAVRDQVAYVHPQA